LTLARKVVSSVDFPLGDVCDTIADTIVQFIIINGPDDIKTVISTSLRHNQLPTRFVNSSDQALRFSLARNIDIERTFDHLKKNRKMQMHWLLYLREKLDATIDDFNDKHLESA
jgi:hypothetical protein